MNETNKDSFIGSLISLESLMESVRKNQCRCIISHFESEEGTKDELNEKMREVEIDERRV